MISMFIQENVDLSKLKSCMSSECITKRAMIRKSSENGTNNIRGKWYKYVCSGMPVDWDTERHLISINDIQLQNKS